MQSTILNVFRITTRGLLFHGFELHRHFPSVFISPYMFNKGSDSKIEPISELSIPIVSGRASKRFPNYNEGAIISWF